MSAVAQPVFAIGLDLRQGRLVREALEQRPFHEVAALIRRLDAWAEQAFGAAADGQPFTLGHADLVLIVRALGDLPYRRVHVLVGSLEAQIAALAGLVDDPAREAA
jgi:hypothetical protein